jgi:rhodanese-related sulfurtransferase
MEELVISCAEFARIRNSVRLVDVREPEEFEEARIGSEQLIPLGELGARAESELPGKDVPTVVYCAHGVRSLYGARLLQHLGFTNVRSLEGGICEWEEFLSGNVAR